MTGAAIAILGLAGCNKNNESTEAPAATPAESAASPASANAAIPASGPAAVFMPIESDMKQKMDDMSAEFGDMLKETLEKMSERINITNSNFTDADMVTSGGVEVEERLQEYSLGK